MVNVAVLATTKWNEIVPNRGLSLTLYVDRLSTTHVRTASRPTGTVWLRSGSTNLGTSGTQAHAGVQGDAHTGTQTGVKTDTGQGSEGVAAPCPSGGS